MQLLPDDVLLKVVSVLQDPLFPEYIMVMKLVDKRFRHKPAPIYLRALEMHMDALRMIYRLNIYGRIVEQPSYSFAQAFEINVSKATPEFTLYNARSFGTVLRMNGMKWLRTLEIRPRDAVPVLEGIAAGGAPRLQTLIVQGDALQDSEPSAEIAPLIETVLRNGGWQQLKTLRLLLPNGGFAFDDLSRFHTLLRPKLPRIESIEIPFVTQDQEHTTLIFST